MDKSVKFLSLNIYVLLCSIVNKILDHVIFESLFSFYSNLKNVPTFPEFAL